MGVLMFWHTHVVYIEIDDLPTTLGDFITFRHGIDVDANDGAVRQPNLV